MWNRSGKGRGYVLQVAWRRRLACLQCLILLPIFCRSRVLYFDTNILARKVVCQHSVVPNQHQSDLYWFDKTIQNSSARTGVRFRLKPSDQFGLPISSDFRSGQFGLPIGPIGSYRDRDAGRGQGVNFSKTKSNNNQNNEFSFHQKISFTNYSNDLAGEKGSFC